MQGMDLEVWPSSAARGRPWRDLDLDPAAPAEQGEMRLGPGLFRAFWSRCLGFLDHDGADRSSKTIVFHAQDDHTVADSNRALC